MSERYNAAELLLEDLADEAFNQTESKKAAQLILQELRNNGVMSEGSFDDNKWSFHCHLIIGTYKYIDFDELEQYDQNKMKSDLTLIVKCWASELLSKMYPSSVAEIISLLRMAIIRTEGFRKENCDEFVEWLQDSSSAPQSKERMIGAVFNFFDYSNLVEANYYVPPLLRLRKKFSFKSKVRVLPPSKEVLKFSYYMERFFNEINIGNEREMILYYPLRIWWNLTTIIPIRSSEFCLIVRKCLSTVKNRCYIKLPRSKFENVKRIQVIDRIEISRELYDLIQNYIKLTNQFGSSNTLISYKSMIWAEPINSQKRLKEKNNHEFFSQRVLRTLISSFYRQIISKRYNDSILKKNQVKPNDTRHFAFLSLMMQGISPIEIARLGGHTTIIAQYHYQQHKEYWVDSEVQKLMSKFKYTQQLFERGTTVTVPLPNSIKNKVYAPYNVDGPQLKLKIGICIDELQRCRYSECMMCDSWRITPEEYLEKEQMILEIYKNRRKNIDELMAFMSNLNRLLLSDELNRRDPHAYLKLKETAHKIDEEINALAKMKLLIEK